MIALLALLAAAVALLLVKLLLGRDPWSLRAAYRREVARRPPAPAAAPDDRITAADLAALPPPVRRFLERAGVVGRPRVRGFTARFSGRMRPSFDAPWMPFVAEQRTTVDPLDRLFLISASRAGIPFVALHRFIGPAATFQVRIASLVDVVKARGPEMDRSETVTFLDDLCLLAPGALLGAGVRFEPIDDRSARATWTRGAETVSAVLAFDAEGDLAGFVSEDRFQSADGRTFRRLPWSTPVSGHRLQDGVRLPARGLAVWLAPEGDLPYLELSVDEVRFDPAAP